MFGVGVYCFEGIGMVMPIEEAMANRERFPPILSLVMIIYTTLCVLSGALGYMAFGDDTEVVFSLFSLSLFLCLSVFRGFNTKQQPTLAIDYWFVCFDFSTERPAVSLYFKVQ